MKKAMQRLQSRFRGALMGTAVADALAFPYRNYSHHFLVSVAHPLAREYQQPAAGFYPSGQYTDDTQTCLAVIDSINERRGLDAGTASAEVFVDHLIPLWRDLLVVDADPDTTEAMQRIVKGITEWNGAALSPGRASSGAITRGIPIGLWDYEHPEDIPDHTAVLVRVTHQDSRALASAAGVAAAVACNVAQEAPILGELLDRIARAAGAFHQDVAQAVLDMPRFLSQTESRALEMILEVCPDERYPPRDDGLGEYAVPVLLIALYHFLKAPHDYIAAVDKSLRVGGNISAVAAVTGALSGSLNGIDALPRKLIEGLVEPEEIRTRADEFFRLRRESTLREIQEREEAEQDAEENDDV